MKSARRETPPEVTEDGCYKPAPALPPLSTPPRADPRARRGEALEDLDRDALVARVLDAEARLAMWEAAGRDFISALALSPQMTHGVYNRMVRELLTAALEELPVIDSLQHVECSMPSVAAEAPTVSLGEWQGLEYSVWNVQWAPASWWVSVSAIGQRWGIGFNCLTRCSNICINGTLRCAFSGDITSLRMSFVTPPQLEMAIESSVGWGAVPIPVREQIEGIVRSEIERFVIDNLTGEESLLVVLRRKALAQITDEDLAEAEEAAKRSGNVKLRLAFLL